MSIQTVLANLRSKPEPTRRKIAFFVPLIITLILFVFWLASFNSFGNSQNAVSASLNKIESPAKSLIAGVGQFFVDVKDMIFGAKKIEYSEVIVSPGK